MDSLQKENFFIMSYFRSKFEKISDSVVNSLNKKVFRQVTHVNNNKNLETSGTFNKIFR